MEPDSSLTPTMPPESAAATRGSLRGPLLAATIGGVALNLLRWLPAMMMSEWKPPPDSHITPALRRQLAASLPDAFLLASILSAVGSVALVALLTRGHAAPLERLGLAAPLPRRSTMLPLGVATAGVLALSVAASMAILALAQAMHVLGGLQVPAITPYPHGNAGLDLAFAVSVAPMAALGDELLYRGYVQRGLIERWSPPRAVLSTAGLSALVLGWPALLHALPLKLFLGWAAYRTNSTRASFTLHAAANVMLFGGVWAAGNWFLLMANATFGHIVLLVVSGALTFAFGLWAFRRSVRSPAGAG